MRLLDLWDIMRAIFLDNFVPTTIICTASLAVILAKNFFHNYVPYGLARACWFFLVISSASVILIFLLTYFRHEEGRTRMALIPYVLCATPLMLCGFAAIFLYPSIQRASKVS